MNGVSSELKAEQSELVVIHCKYNQCACRAIYASIGVCSYTGAELLYLPWTTLIIKTRVTI